MLYTIKVPKPCHESWEAMTPEQSGRHCAQCSKTVIDFTTWQQQDILVYMQQGSAGVCGRFKTEQLNVPLTAGQFTAAVIHSPLPFYKQVAAIFLFAFGMLQMSCGSPEQTKPTVVPQAAQDTVKEERTTLGMVNTIRQPEQHDTVVKTYVKPVIHDDTEVMIVPEEPSKQDIRTGAVELVPFDPGQAADTAKK